MHGTMRRWQVAVALILASQQSAQAVERQLLGLLRQNGGQEPWRALFANDVETDDTVCNNIDQACTSSDDCCSGFCQTERRLRVNDSQHESSSLDEHAGSNDINILHHKKTLPKHGGDKGSKASSKLTKGSSSKITGLKGSRSASMATKGSKGATKENSRLPYVKGASKKGAKLVQAKGGGGSSSIGASLHESPGNAVSASGSGSQGAIIKRLKGLRSNGIKARSQSIGSVVGEIITHGVCVAAPSPRPVAKSVPSPARQPTRPPTKRPTRSTTKPTRSPTKRPIQVSTPRPTRRPTRPLTAKPTRRPTQTSTARPTRRPTQPLSARPTRSPTAKPVAPVCLERGVPCDSGISCCDGLTCFQNDDGPASSCL